MQHFRFRKMCLTTDFFSYCESVCSKLLTWHVGDFESDDFIVKTFYHTSLWETKIIILCFRPRPNDFEEPWHLYFVDGCIFPKDSLDALDELRKREVALATNDDLFFFKIYCSMLRTFIIIIIIIKRELRERIKIFLYI